MQTTTTMSVIPFLFFVFVTFSCLFVVHSSISMSLDVYLSISHPFSMVAVQATNLGSLESPTTTGRSRIGRPPRSRSRRATCTRSGSGSPLSMGLRRSSRLRRSSHPRRLRRSNSRHRHTDEGAGRPDTGTDEGAGRPDTGTDEGAGNQQHRDVEDPRRS